MKKRGKLDRTLQPNLACFPLSLLFPSSHAWMYLACQQPTRSPLSPTLYSVTDSFSVFSGSRAPTSMHGYTGLSAEWAQRRKPKHNHESSPVSTLMWLRRIGPLHCTDDTLSHDQSFILSPPHLLRYNMVSHTRVNMSSLMKGVNFRKVFPHFKL